MRYLLFTVGTLGDLHPYVALGIALKQAGDDVSVITNADYRRRVEAAGLDCIALEYDVTGKYVNDPGFFSPEKTWKLALEHCYLGPMRQTYEVIARYAERERVGVVSAAWGFGARVAHEALGVPLVTLHLEPHNIRSVYKTARMHPFLTGDFVPWWFKRLQFNVADRFFIDPLIAPGVNAFRQELGLTTVKRLLADWWNSPQKIVGMYSDWFSPPQPDWPPQLELAGFPSSDDTQQTDVADDVVEFAAKHRPLVFTTGSNHMDAGRQFAAAIECCRKLDRYGVLLTRQQLEIPADLSGRVRQFSYVPLQKILPHAAALVHHGGAGTTAAALRSGVPQLVSPGVHGTVDIAERLKRLGVAEVLAAKRFKPHNVCNKLKHLLDNSQVRSRCELYRRKMQEVNGIERCATIVQRVCDENLSPPQGRPQ